MWFYGKITYVLLLIPFVATGFEPGNLGADSLIAFYETEASFTLPGYDSLTAAEPQLPIELVNIAFSNDDDIRERAPGLIGDKAKIGEYTYTEIHGDGGPDDFHIEAFSGLEVNKFDVLGRYYETGYFGDTSPLDVRNRGAQFGLMYSETGGTVLSANTIYSARRDVLSDKAVPYSNTDVDYGGIDMEYGANLWSNSKLSSRLSGTYGVHYTDETRYKDYYLSADFGFNTFLWADNLSKVNFAISQDTLNCRGVKNTETLFGVISLNNDIPLTDWMNIGIGFTRYMHKNEELTARNYAYGALHFQLGRRTGVYIQYNPKLTVLSFEDLYLDRRFTRVNEIPLFDDTYFSAKAGITERLLENLSVGISVYQTRSRSYPAMFDYNGDIGLEYYNAGRVQINGGSIEYDVNLFDFISNSGYYMVEDVTVETTGEFVPYKPRDRAGVSLRLYYNDRFSVEAELNRMGRRLYLSDSYLPVVHTLGARGEVKLIDGLEVYVQGNNIADESYELIRGIRAPGRTLSLGARVKL